MAAPLPPAASASARWRRLAACLVVIALAALWGAPAAARSALSPRHTGMEPPGGPRQTDVMSGHGPTRTAEGGMGYTDAYGNTLDDSQPPEKAPRNRPRAGAYGGYGARDEARPLPDPGAGGGAPVWSFR